MSNVVQLPAQSVYDTPRSIAGINFALTRINGILHLSTEQSMQLLNINVNTLRHHNNAIDAEESTGTMPSYPCYITYEIPVFYPSDPGSNRAGVTNITQFHHPKKLFKIATRTRNTPRKSEVMEWLINLGNEVVQHGYVVDQFAAQNDPNVVQNLQAELAKAKQDAKYWQYKYNDAAEYGFDQE